jgi:sugar diacid utilization regulator
MTNVPQILYDRDSQRRDQVSDLYGLFTLSTMMFGARDGPAILRLCASSVPALGTLQVEAAYLVGESDVLTVDIGTAPAEDLLDRVVEAGTDGGSLRIDGRAWARAVPLVGLSGHRGYLAVSAPAEPKRYECFLLDIVGRQAGAALENAALYREVAQYAASLRALNRERDDVNQQLSASVRDLERRSQVHEMLTRASTAKDVVTALVRTVRDVTGLTAGIEGAFGTVEQWATTGHVDEYERMSVAVRDEVGRAALARAGRAVRVKDRVVALARPGNETLGAVALIDPRRTVGDYEVFVLEQAAVVLGMELSHRRSLIEVEMRLRRQLVDDLVSGTDDVDSALVRAAAVGHDLSGPHRVVVVHWQGLSDFEFLVSAVERVIAHLGLRALVARRAGNVVLLVSGDVPAREFYERISTDLRSSTGSIGIGARAEPATAFPRSLEEAQHALGIRARSKNPYGATTFEDLGIYRILAVGDTGELDAYVTQWLGVLIGYDASRHSSLVETLAEYLDHGGNYDQTAESLVIHRSTLRYRLRRIRELAGVDLTDVESRLNLHVATRAWRILEGG